VAVIRLESSSRRVEPETERPEDRSETSRTGLEDERESEGRRAKRRGWSAPGKLGRAVEARCLEEQDLEEGSGPRSG
jgi:hypothetical protein